MLNQVDIWPSSDNGTIGNVTFTVIAQHTVVGVTSISQVSSEQSNMHCGITLQVRLSSFSTMMWDFASVVGMQDLALLLPPIPLYAAGYVPPFDMDLSAAGMHNITTVVSNVTDGLPNGTVRC